MNTHSPTPDDVRTARRAAGLTQQQAATLCHYAHFQYWSALERGESTMSPQAWELFMIKIGIHPSFGPRAFQE